MTIKRIKRLLCMFLSVLISLCQPVSTLALGNANPDSRESVRLMDTGGHTQAEAVAWARDRANESWSEDVDGVYGCQCVDLIKAYYKYLGNSYVLGNACDYQSNALPAGWYRDNTPSPGAVAVWAAYTTIQHGWDTDQYGHVGIVVEVNGSTLKTVETNAAWRQYARYLDRPAGNVTCFIHPDFSPAVLYVDFSNWEDSNYTYVRETDAAIGQNINVSGGTCTDTGIYLYDTNGNLLANCANGYYTSPVCFWINSELGYTLTPGTTYKYRFYAVVNGQTYWSNESSFTTSGKVQSAKTADINTVSRNGNTITANILCSNSNASVFCGVYTNSGKMIAAHSVQITSESSYQFQFDGQQFDYAKVFIIDSDFRPLCESVRT